MTIEDITAVVTTCSFPDYAFYVTKDSRGSIYLQGVYNEPDTVTKELSRQFTRRWFLNLEMTKSEIVQTVFKCVITSMEHKTREWFHYQGNPIFGPHFDVDLLLTICKQGKFDTRKG